MRSRGFEDREGALLESPRPLQVGSLEGHRSQVVQDDRQVGGARRELLFEDRQRATVDLPGPVQVAAIQGRDGAFLKGISPSLMKDGTSELLNWVSASGCLLNTALGGELIDYVPCYRTEAGSGTAQGFLAWT